MGVLVGLYATPLDAFSDPQYTPLTITLPTTDTVYFGVSDNILYDNRGGLSELIQAVPEPSTYLAGLSALGMLGFFGWRKRKY